MNLYIWKPKSDSQDTYFVVADSEQASIRAIESQFDQSYLFRTGWDGSFGTDLGHYKLTTQEAVGVAPELIGKVFTQWPQAA